MAAVRRGNREEKVGGELIFQYTVIFKNCVCVVSVSVCKCICTQGACRGQKALSKSLTLTLKTGRSPASFGGSSVSTQHNPEGTGQHTTICGHITSDFFFNRGTGISGPHVYSTDAPTH